MLLYARNTHYYWYSFNLFSYLLLMDKSIFASSTLLGRQEFKKLTQLLQILIDSPDSFQFRYPVDWKTLGLMDYPTVIKNPMDLNTIKKNLASNHYETVEACLNDVQLIWNNCKTYNNKENWIYKIADKLEKMTKKMAKNYLPFVNYLPNTDKRKTIRKEITGKKAPTHSVQEPKHYLQIKEEQNQPVEEAKPPVSEFMQKKYDFLSYVPFCSLEQVGVLFLLIRNNNPEALRYDQEGNCSVLVELLGETIMNRMMNQLDMWGVGYVAPKKK